jgi:hypothetical protein
MNGNLFRSTAPSSRCDKRTDEMAGYIDPDSSYYTAISNARPRNSVGAEVLTSFGCMAPSFTRQQIYYTRSTRNEFGNEGLLTHLRKAMHAYSDANDVIMDIRYSGACSDDGSYYYYVTILTAQCRARA